MAHHQRTKYTTHMKLRYEKTMVHNPTLLLRKAGYVPFTDPKTGKESFTLRLQSGFYPRFHLYVKEDGDAYIFDLHLDQKQPSYGGSHMHNGEYDGPVVEAEIGRIDRWVKYLATQSE